MKQEISTPTGKNRTGMAMSPIDSRSLLDGVEEVPASASLDGRTREAIAAPYIEEKVLIGSVPPPSSIKGVGKIAVALLQGERAAVLIDKLGERLAFERTGTRLYEAVISKAQLSAVSSESMLEELEAIHDEELAHFHLVKDFIESLGGDPTAVTPSADVVAVASSGLVKVVTDPRTTLPQCLEALLVAELADNDGWTTLIQLAERFGQREMVEHFLDAREAEQRHLSKVRGWLASFVTAEASLAAP